MNDKYYFQYIWSTLMSSFDFRGKAGRTEYAYFFLFYISCLLLITPLYVLLIGNPHGILKGKVSVNPILFSLYNCYLLFLLWISFSTIALIFRRCRDIGNTMLVLIPCMVFVISIVSALDICEILNFGDTNIVYILLLLCQMVSFVFQLLLIFKKGKENLSKSSEDKSYPICARIKRRYIALVVVTIAFLLSLFIFHFNYEYTDWFIDEWIIMCCAIAVYFVIIAFYYLIISRKLFWH